MSGVSDSEGTRPDRSGLFGPGSSAKAIRLQLSVSVDGREFPGQLLSQGEYLVGNHPTCDIEIAAPDVGRRHARLILNAYELFVERRGETKVFVDGVPVELPTRFHPDQEIQIGHARLRLAYEPDSRAQLAAALWDADLGLDLPKRQLTGKRYRVSDLLGEGGMGIVMEARDQRIRRSVAMKVMHSGQQFSKENVLRFIDEAQLTGQLEHPNIVPVYELGVDGEGHAFYTMKRVQGTTLKQILREIRSGETATTGSYPLAHLLTIFQKVCDAVAFAHSKQVVHRDLKPSNIMIGDYGEVLVMDWGLAKVRGTVDKVDPKRLSLLQTARAEASGSYQTMDGVVLGTPPYIAPEQARGLTAEIDHRSDIYVLGAILYTILALRRPVEGADMEEVLQKITDGDILPPHLYNKGEWPEGPPEVQAWHDFLNHCPGKRIPRALSAVAMKALATKPEDRYQTVEEFQRDLEAYQDGFATKAEQAGLGTQLALLFRRHRTLVLTVITGMLLLFLVIAGAAFGVYSQQNRALRTVQEALEKERLARAEVSVLRGRAPALIVEAEALIFERKFESALKKISAAAAEVPNDPSYHRLKGNMLQSLFRFESAAKSYKRAQELAPGDSATMRNLELSHKLHSRKKGRQELLLVLQEQMRLEHRFSEALELLDHLPPAPEIILLTWQEYLTSRRFRGELTEGAGDAFALSLRGEPQPDLTFLRHVPLSELHLDGVRVPDLSVLGDLSLESLSLTGMTLPDLSPLNKLPLKQLSLRNSDFSDLSPLEGMKLEELDLSGTGLSDLTPLAGLPLRVLLLDRCENLTDLSPLKGLSLHRLGISYTSVTSLAPVQNMPLKEINTEGCYLPDEPFVGELDELESALKE